MAATDRHRQVTAIVLRAATGHGFALAGGNALLTHNVISRPTADVDLFTDDQHGVQNAAAAVAEALNAARSRAEAADQANDLADIFPEIGQGLAEWIITAPDGQQIMLQLAYFTRTRPPVCTLSGPEVSRLLCHHLRSARPGQP